MTKFKKADLLRQKSKNLWKDYLKCTDLKKSSKLLNKWSKAVDSASKVQDEINSLFINKKLNDNKINYVQEAMYVDGRNRLVAKTIFAV